MFKVRHHEFAQVSMDRFAESQIDIVRFRDCPPGSMYLIQSQHMIVILAGIRAEVDEERFESDMPESQGSEESTIQAVTLSIPHHVERRAIALLADVRHA